MASVFARVLSAAGLALWSSQAPIPLVGVHLSRRGVHNERPRTLRDYIPEIG